MRLPNSRDLGGLTSADGRSLRSGLVLRAAAPQSDEHAEALAGLGVTHALDLRTHEERELRPDVLPPGTSVIVADLLADEPAAGAASLGSIARAALQGETEAMTIERLDEIFVNGYRSFVSLDSARAATATVLRHVAHPDSGPVVVHCTAGKDRTGWVVAVLLTTLGVPWDTVMADYLRSGPEVLALFAPFRERVAASGGDVEAMERAIAVFPHYLDAARDQMLTTYGDWDTYVNDGLGVDESVRAALVQRLLA